MTVSQPITVVHHTGLVAALPPGHRFPMGKFAALAETLVGEGIVAPGGFVVPEPAPAEWVALAHERAYVEGVFAADLPGEVARRIGFPVNESVALRARLATGGTVMVARLALQEGMAFHTAGGSHHAGPAHGAGFCVFNDVAVAARLLLEEGAISRALVIDLDVHQGDGTAAIFAGDPDVFTFSIHGEKNFPIRKVDSDLDIALADGTGDTAYLAALENVLETLFDHVRPDLVFYNAGVDPHEDDRLGRLALSDAGLFARDTRVLSACRTRGVPVAVVIGGGYGEDVRVLGRRHATVHRAGRALLGKPAPGGTPAPR